jgi:hypothetical protein
MMLSSSAPTLMLLLRLPVVKCVPRHAPLWLLLLPAFVDHLLFSRKHPALQNAPAVLQLLLPRRSSHHRQLQKLTFKTLRESVFQCRVACENNLIHDMFYRLAEQFKVQRLEKFRFSDVLQIFQGRYSEQDVRVSLAKMVRLMIYLQH